MEPSRNGKFPAMPVARRAVLAAAPSHVAGLSRAAFFTYFGATMEFWSSRPVLSVYGGSWGVPSPGAMDGWGAVPARMLPSRKVLLTMFRYVRAPKQGDPGLQTVMFNRGGTALCFNAALKTNTWAARAGPFLSVDRRAVRVSR